MLIPVSSLSLGLFLLTIFNSGYKSYFLASSYITNNMLLYADIQHYRNFYLHFKNVAFVLTGR